MLIIKPDLGEAADLLEKNHEHFENGFCFQGHGDNKESQQRNGFGCSRRPRL